MSAHRSNSIVCNYLLVINCSRVFDNRVLRKAFSPKRDELTMEWCRLHNEEF